MRRQALGVLGLFLGIAAAVGWSRPSLPLNLAPESRIWVEGTSTLRSFTCKATTFDAAVIVADSASIRGVLSGEKAVATMRLDVPTSRLECGNGTMNSHMLTALKAKDNPLIGFRLEAYELAKAAEGQKGTLSGVLSIGGVEKPVSVTVDLTEGTEGALHVSGAYDLSMRDFELKPPSLMLGTIKVGDRIKVRFDLLLKN